MVLGASAVLATLLGVGALGAAPVPVRFVEGVAHGFLLLRAANGTLLATGDLLQVSRGAQLESRIVFRFKDGSLFDETVTYTQQRVFELQSYHLVQRGPAFSEDSEITIERASRKYRTSTRSRKDGRAEVLEGTLELPSDVYNGMVLTIAKNLAKGASETVHYLAFTPRPQLIELEVAPSGEHRMFVGELAKTAVHYTFKAKLGAWTEFFAKLLGRLPADYHVWIDTDEVPAFVRFDGPLTLTGQPWRIELTSPRWPD